MPPMTFVVKDSGARAEFASGMVRDTNEGKPRFDLLRPIGVPYEAQFLTRLAAHMAKGASKYGDRNWEHGDSADEIARARESAERHLNQWLAGDVDEDHAAATVVNILFAEMTAWKMERQ